MQRPLNWSPLFLTLSQISRVPEIYKVTRDASTKMEYDGKNKPIKSTGCPK